MRKFISILIVSSLANLSEALTILVYLTLVGRSHLDLTSTLINKLTERGHTVDLIIGRLNSDIPSNGSHSARNIVAAEFEGKSPWNKLPHISGPFDVMPSDKMWIGTSLPTFNRCTTQLCDRVLQNKEIAEHLSTHKYDLALVSVYDGCPLALAHKYGITKVLTFSTLPATHYEQLSSGLPDLPAYEYDSLHTQRLFDPESFLHRSLNFIRTHYMRIAGEADFYNSMNSVVRSHYGADFPDVKSLYQKVFYEFVNANAMLERPRPTSQRIKFIGGIGFQRGKEVTEQFYVDLLKSSRKGIVIISFGSQVPAASIPSNIVEGFLQAAKTFPDHTFLWKYNAKLENATNNLVSVDWLPQNDLLQSPQVVGFVSHTGLNSFTETLYAGVPVISIPLFADQLHNGLNVARLGSGIVLKKIGLNGDKITEALRQILSDDRYRTRAKELAEMLAMDPATPTRTFVETVEFAVQFENINDITFLPGGRLSTMAHYGYDIVLCLNTLSLVSLFLLLKTLGRFLSVSEKVKNE